ncbi:MAG: cyclase family protein [Lachnotalea sp.]
MSTIETMEQLLKSIDIIDMSRTLEPGMPNWPTQPPYSAIVYETQKWGAESFHRGIFMSEHTGTHVDAGSHFVPGKESVDEIPIDRLMGRAVNVDATKTAKCKCFEKEELIRFEENYGEIKAGDIVYFRFGWDEKYDLKPEGSEFMQDWPGISKEIGNYLLEKEVKAVGTDCMSLDAYGSTNPNHTLLLGNDINIIENVNRLKDLPIFFYTMGLPCKLKDGSGSTLRLIAFIDK